MVVAVNVCEYVWVCLCVREILCVWVLVLCECMWACTHYSDQHKLGEGEMLAKELTKLPPPTQRHGAVQSNLLFIPRISHFSITQESANAVTTLHFARLATTWLLYSWPVPQPPEGTRGGYIQARGGDGATVSTAANCACSSGGDAASILTAGVKIKSFHTTHTWLIERQMCRDSNASRSPPAFFIYLLLFFCSMRCSL